MVVADGTGLPLGDYVSSASPAEVTLAEKTLQTIVGRRPERLITDRAHDSDPLRTRLAAQGIELICPHRRGRKRKAAAEVECFRLELVEARNELKKSLEK